MQPAVVMVLAGMLASQYHGRAWRHVTFVASSRVEARTLAGASPQQAEAAHSFRNCLKARTEVN